MRLKITHGMLIMYTLINNRLSYRHDGEKRRIL